jgi:hypothetical protein
VMACGPTDQGEVGPYGRPDRVVTAGLECAACFRVGRRPLCCTHAIPSACMKQISVEQMLAAVGSCLRRSAGPADRQDISTSPETSTDKSSPVVSTSACIGVGP